MNKICCECKSIIKHDNYYYIDPIKKYLCSSKCRESYAKKEKEKSDRAFLYEQIERIWNVTFPTGQQLAEIKRYCEKEGMTYRQIASVIHYIYDVCEKRPYGQSLYLVLQEKDAARNWYLENARREAQAKQMANLAPAAARKVVPKVENKRRGRLQEINPEDV